MVNRNTEEPGAKLNQNQNLGVFDEWGDYSAAEISVFPLSHFPLFTSNEPWI